MNVEYIQTRNCKTTDKMAEQMTVKGYADKVKCPTLLATGEFDPLCPLEDAVEVYEDLTCKKLTQN